MSTVLTFLGWLSIAVLVVFVLVQLALCGINALNDFGDDFKE
jgi:hypothetical protein